MKIKTQISCSAIRKTLSVKRADCTQISGIYSAIATSDTHKKARLHARPMSSCRKSQKIGP